MHNNETEIHDLRAKAAERDAKESALQLVREIAAGAAHNFNNVLQIIMGAASLMQMTNDPDKKNSYADQIIDAVRKGNMIATRLSRFARTMTEHGDPQPIDISELVSNAVENSRIFWYTKPARAGKHVTLKQHIVPNLHTVGLEGELSEVLLNLIKNACEAMVDGGVLYISAEPGMGSILIKVTDTGPGIPKAIMSRIFSPFFTTKGSEGTGMGLATCRQIIEHHDGSLSVSSAPGQTTFTIALPDSSQFISKQP